MPGESFRCGSLGVQNSLTGTYVPGEFGGSGGCWRPAGGSQPACSGCGGGGFPDVGHHVAVALRCLTATWQSTGSYGWQHANQQVRTEDTAIFTGTAAAEQFGIFPGTVEAADCEVKCVLSGPDAEPLVVAEVLGSLCDEPSGVRDSAGVQW